jgi:hypothetical protein
MVIIYQGGKYLFASMDASAIRDKFKNVEKVGEEQQGKRYLTSQVRRMGQNRGRKEVGVKQS